jgi:hypothetical protein
MHLPPDCVEFLSGEISIVVKDTKKQFAQTVRLYVSNNIPDEILPSVTCKPFQLRERYAPIQPRAGTAARSFRVDVASFDR